VGSFPWVTPSVTLGPSPSTRSPAVRERAEHGADLGALVLEHELLRLHRGTLRDRLPHEEDGRDAERDGRRGTPEAAILPLQTIDASSEDVHHGLCHGDLPRWKLVTLPFVVVAPIRPAMEGV
jgi:hypothetical protein